MLLLLLMVVVQRQQLVCYPSSTPTAATYFLSSVDLNNRPMFLLARTTRSPIVWPCVVIFLAIRM